MMCSQLKICKILPRLVCVEKVAKFKSDMLSIKAVLERMQLIASAVDRVANVKIEVQPMGSFTIAACLPY